MLLVAYLRSLFETLKEKFPAFVRAFALFKQIRLVSKAANDFSMTTWQTLTNPLYFKRFGFHSRGAQLFNFKASATGTVKND